LGKQWKQRGGQQQYKKSRPRKCRREGKIEKPHCDNKLTAEQRNKGRALRRDVELGDREWRKKKENVGGLNKT